MIQRDQGKAVNRSEFYTKSLAGLIEDRAWVMRCMADDGSLNCTTAELRDIFERMEEAINE